MSKYYGVICDRCGKVITSPAEHNKVSLRKQLERGHVWVKDICNECMYKLENFMKEIGKENQL